MIMTVRERWAEEQKKWEAKFQSYALSPKAIQT